MDDNIVTKRTSVPLIKKIEAAEEYLRLKRNGLFGVKELARELNLQPAQIRRYAANLSNHRSKLYESRKTYTTLRTGRRSQLYDIENEVVTWIMELRNEGMPVSTNLVVMKARSLMPNEFNNKNEMTQYQAVSRMLKRHNIVIRSKTNEAQRAPAEVRAEGDAYVKGLVNRLQGPHRDKRWIANMDQTPLFFSMTPKRTLDKRGLRTVNVRKSSSSTMRVTMAVTVTAAGTTLPPYFVFKGKPGGRIEKREFTTFPEGAFYSVQDNAWMDQHKMIDWVENVVKPWGLSTPEGIVPILLLDSYRCHLMTSVVDLNQQAGVEVEFIPGGLTGLCQPLDIGVNKPLKNRVYRKWEEYMLSVGLDQVKTKPPTRLTMVEWAVSSLNSISEQIIKNAWRLSNYDYFPNEPKENDTTNNDEETETEVEMLDFSETETEVEMLDISDAEIDELHDVEIEAI